jgi:flagellar basal body-associated protein FliL
MNPTNQDTTTPPQDAPTPQSPVNPDVPVTPETVQAPQVTPVVEPVAAPVAAPSAPSPFFGDANINGPLGTSANGTPPSLGQQETPPATVNSAASTPANPVGVTPVAPAPQPPKSRKKLILIISIVSGFLLLAAAAVVVFLLLTTVSKQDYRAAAQQFNKVSQASSKLITDVTGLGASTDSTSESAFNASVKETQDSLANIKTENEALSKLKAVRIGEGAKLYKTFSDKTDAYLVYGNGLLISVKNLRPAMLTCDKINDTTTTAARVAALNACATSLGGISDLPNADFKTLVGVLKDSYTSYTKSYEAMSALTSPFGAQYDQYKTLRDEMYATQDKITAASNTFKDAINKRDDELSVKPSSQALADYLAEKQR